MKICMAGQGAFGIKHLEAIKLIDGVEVVSLVSREIDKTREVAANYGIGHVTTRQNLQFHFVKLDNKYARVLDVTRNVVRLQSGYLYHYAFAMLIGAAMLMTYFMFAGSH